MKVIRMSKKVFNSLSLLQLTQEIMNTEGSVYNYNYHGEEKVFKRLYHIEGKIFGSKLYTIEMLNNMKEYLPKSFYIPDALVTVNDTVEGFTIPKADGVNLATILKTKMDYKEHLYYLKKVGEILEQLHNIRTYTSLDDVFINDLHEANFIINPNNQQMGVIDLDSCKIKNNMIFASRYLTPCGLLNNNENKYQIINETESNYHVGYVIPNENTDLYCYSIMILNYLYGQNINNLSIDEFYEYLNYLESLKINKNLIDVWAKLLVNTPNLNPCDYINSLKENQIYRSRKIVYDKVK